MKVNNPKLAEHIEYLNNVKINTKYEFLKYVKNNEGIYVPNIIRKFFEYENFMVVMETAFYEHMEEDIWLWFFHKEKGLFIFEEIKYKPEDIIKLLIECDFDVNKIENY